ncbi:radical SAM protein [Chloroflexota bacterium]
MKKYFIKDNVCTPYKLILGKTSNYLTANGWTEASSIDKADTIIVGVCAAFHSLKNESIELIDEAKQASGSLVVFGCLPQVIPESVKKFKPDQIIPSSNWEQLEKLIDHPTILMSEIEESGEFKSKEDYRLYDSGKRFILIQTGCSSDCPYCPHKMGIGELKSRTIEDILEQIQSLVKKDVHTIVLTGNDTGSYGTDKEDITFPDLLQEVLKISPKVHLSQINPDWVYKYQQELYPLLLDEKIKEFQVLIQTVSERLLEIMERGPIVRELKPFLMKLRQARKDILFRTDIIIGFPTATLEEELETLEYVAELFDEVAVHGFERFPHTRIEKMSLPFHPQDIIDWRVERALKFLKDYPGILVHRGGQVYQTLLDIEKPKDDMRKEREC